MRTKEIKNEQPSTGVWRFDSSCVTVEMHSIGDSLGEGTVIESENPIYPIGYISDGWNLRRARRIG